MAIFRGRYKKGNFRGIRKTGKIAFLGLWRSLAAGWSFFRTTKKEALISGPRKIGPNFRTTKNRPIFGAEKTAQKTRFLGPGNKTAF